MTDTLFIRLLHHEDKGATLAEKAAALRKGHADGDVYAVSLESFRQVPNTPFCYWVSERIRRLFKELPPFESEGRTVKQGLATADDFRFVRAWWEVPSERILGNRQSEVGGGEKWTEEQVREFQTWCRQRTYEGKCWVSFAKGGEYSPYYADIHLVVNWKNGGAEIRNFVNPKTGKTNSRPQNTDYYFRPGLTYTSYTNLGFAPRILQAGSVFSIAGMGIHGIQPCMLVFLNSKVVQLFLYLIADRRKWEAGVIQRLPVPELSEHIIRLNASSNQTWSLKRSLDLVHDIFHAFTLPALLQVQGATLTERATEYAKRAAETDAELRRLQAEIDEIAFDLYRFTEEERRTVVSSPGSEMSERKTEGQESTECDEDAEAFDSNNQPLTTARYISDLLSWCASVAFGRFDIRLALDPGLVPAAPDLFDPLPVCPPGMLVGPDGLPAGPGRIVSEEWLRARPDANTLPAAGAVKNPTIPDSDYPLRISWDGVLVDDPGFNGGQPHRDDIVRRVREVLDLLWKDKAYEIEQEACDILGVSDLRDYFRRPTGFFQDHLKRYSKSRRKAPIYQPISTASGSYTLWFYYHRLTDQTLYAAVNKYVEPKIAEVEYAVGSMQKAVEARERGRNEGLLTAYSILPTGQLRQELDEALSFLNELEELRGELLRIAQLPYKPNLNDGVIINAAPLHNLFRLRTWANDTKKVWGKLEKGDYDWAHLAYTIWPERVREVCKKDRSIAIAHGLEDICEVEAPAPRKKGGRSRRKTMSIKGDA